MNLVSALLLMLAPLSWAVMPDKSVQADAKRFAFHARRNRAAASAGDDKAAWDFNHQRGLKPMRAGGRVAHAQVPPQVLAQQFLAEAKNTLGIDPASLTLERMNGAPGHMHLLYRQSYKGVPVEFSYVKVHLADNGAVLGVDTNYAKSLNVNAVPAMSAAQAATFVAMAGATAVDAGSVVVLPDAAGGAARLAWKFSAAAKGGRWSYYVDAGTGAVLFRHRRERNICGTSGTMQAQIYDIDPLVSAIQTRPLAHMRVFQGDQFTWADTGIDGSYCGAGIGKIFTEFQGPFVNVSDFNGPSAHYDNGSGVWSTVATPLSSPHPYAPNSVYIATVDLRGIITPSAVKVLPVFNNFNVGQIGSVNGLGEGGDIIVDDQLAVLNSSGDPVASYLGNKGTFNGAAVPGQLYYLQLKSAATPGPGTGYDLVVSSYLTLSNPYVATGIQSPPNVAGSQSVVWYGTMTPIGLRSEFNLFYHLNLMHDYFMFGAGVNGASLYGNDNLGNPIRGVDISSAAYIGKPMHALSLVGPNIQNPFYDPAYDDIVFGDVSALAPADILTDDATVSHHEYTHYVVEKIWSPSNFGEAGAISEGDADYFSASSLNHAEIGTYVVQSYGGGHVPIRELDSAGVSDTCGVTPAVLNSNTWQGEIHCDSRFLSQAVWDIRKSRVALQGLGPGAACVDGLVFQSLLFYPESFDEYVKAMLKVDSMGLVPACAVNACGGSPGVPGNPVNCVQATIAAAFNAHGVQNVGGTNDPYDTVLSRNDGFETAVDIATIPAITATIYPAGDLDFFTFPAGVGPVTATMNLPADTNNPGLHKAYTITLYDVQHHQIAQAIPPLDGVNTIQGFCAGSDCTTSAHVVQLNFYNTSPGQMFIEIQGGPTFAGGSNSGVNSVNPYHLNLQYQPGGAITGSIVSVKFDNDMIGFQVDVTTWLHHQDYFFAYAQLRDHTGTVIPNTLTHPSLQAGDWLAMISSQNAVGTISGSLQLQQGFAAQHPSLGTVSLEVFGYDTFGSTVSLGRSVPFNLTTNKTALTAFNNVFSPSAGQNATIKYEIQEPGHVTLRLYTLGGQFIATLLDEDEPAGKGSLNWSGVNVTGRVVASGVYLLYMKGPNISQTQKIVVVK